MLAPLVQAGLSAWDETHIQPGQPRQQTIEAALAESHIAVLLVSAEFLVSDFLGNQLAALLAAAHRDKGLRVFWFAVRPCLWRETALVTYEPVHDGDQPLSTLSDADTALAQICGRIKQAVAPASTSVEPSSRANPYQGLAAFQSEQSHLFFGRDSLTQQLCKNFQALFDKKGATRLLTILGPSGSGKSSVARAGLLAALSRFSIAGAQTLRIATFKPGSRPLESLSRALVPLFPPETPMLPARRALEIEALLRSTTTYDQGLRRFADALPEIDSRPLVLLVDQFEEIYTLCPDSAERDSLVALLIHAAEEGTRHVAVVLTLRSDFMGETQRYHASLNRLIAAHAVLVPAMSPEELYDAIAQPALQAGHPIDPATVELLLSEARGSRGSLPLLEFALTRIWEGIEHGKEPGLTLRKLGGVGGALAGEAQKIYTSLSIPEQSTARRALVRLVQLGEGTRDTRRRVPIAELCGRAETSETVLSILRQFAGENARLVTLAGDEAEVVAEVTHEALFDHWQELRQWIDESRADRRFHDRVVEAARLWQESGRPPGRLWRPPDLEMLRDYQRRRPQELGSLQESFLAAALRQQRQERRLSAGAMLTVVSTVLLAAGIYVVKERQRAQEERRRAQEEQRRTREVHDKLLDSYVERGRQLLFENGSSSEGLLWLHRAQGEGSQDPALSHLLKSAMQSVDATSAILIGHGESVKSAAFSPDGRHIATASLDNTARVWAAASGRQVAELKGHGSSVNSAAFSPDSRRIVTASLDNTARIWETTSGRPVAELRGHKSSVYSAMFSPDGRRIVTASGDNTARLWDAEGGRLILELRGHKASVYTATFSFDSRRIVTASGDNTARLWDTGSGRLLLELKGHESSVYTATFSPDGRRIITASGDKTARLWDAERGRLIAELKGHESSVNNATFSPDGRRIVTASLDNTARVWEAEGGRLVAELRGHGESVNSATFSPDSRFVITASWDKTARLWEVEGGRLAAEFKGHGESVNSAMFSPDGRLIVTASWDKTARLWKAEGGRLMTTLKGHKESVNSATFSPDGHFIVTASGDHTSRVWESVSGRIVAELVGHGLFVNSAAFSSDGRLIVTASRDHTARLWEAASGRLVAELAGHGASVNSAMFSADGRYIVTASDDKTARLWESISGRLVAELKGHEKAVKSARFSPDSRLIVTASDDKTACLWEVEGGHLVAKLKGHVESVNSASFSRDGRRIITAGRDNTARVWDVESGQLVAELKGHESSVNSATFSPDGRRVATASRDKTARVWEAESGRLLAELKGHGFFVNTAMFSPDGHLIVTASRDKTARVWEADGGRLVAELRGHGESIHSATFSPDGRLVVTTSWDKTARVWDISPETRTHEQLAKLLHCYVPASFEREGSNIIVFRMPTPADCQQELPP